MSSNVARPGWPFALSLCLVSCAASAQQVAARDTWIMTVDLWGNPAYSTLELEQDGPTLAGSLDGDAVKGQRKGGELRFVATDAQRSSATYVGTLKDGTLVGTADMPDTNNPKARVTHSFRARRLEARKPGPPRRHEYKPASYSNEFSPHRAPALTIWPKDTVHTTTIDSGGVDERGETKALFGNPQTGPFFVAGARPGDTLAIRIDRLRTNRDYADSLDSIVGRALSTGMAANAAGLGKPIRWTVDAARGVAFLAQPTERLKGFRVPLRPMLGGLAVAPGFGSAPVSTGDTGRFGGNMDFNEVVEGNTVYLPVMQPGALLYLGDAHAAQGDGETSQYALETSMDVEFTVDVLPGNAIAMPLVESPTHLMALGQAGSLDDALRSATAGLTQWLERDYGLSLSESAQVLGSAVEYKVANLAGRSVGVVAKLAKQHLAALTKVPPSPPK